MGHRGSETKNGYGLMNRGKENYSGHKEQCEYMGIRLEGLDETLVNVQREKKGKCRSGRGYKLY